MSSWDAMSPDGKDTILRVVRREAEGFLALAERPGVWEEPTGSREWQVRDVVGHIVDVTENYFERFEAARGGLEVEPAYGLPGMAARLDGQAKAFRNVPQQELVERLRTDFAEMMGLLEALTPQDWTGLQVPHFYMGPLPAFFYPAFQLMDYGVHSWDLRQGTGRAHGFSGEAADLLVPFMFVLWQYTVPADPARERSDVGIRITSGPNAGDTLVHVGPAGMAYEPGAVTAAVTMLEFDPGSFVLTAFGRCNAGTIRGDRAIADRYLNLFFRI